MMLPNLKQNIRAFLYSYRIKLQLFSLLAFAGCVALFFFLESNYALSGTAYYVYHVLYGLGFTFLFFVAFDSFPAATFFTLGLSFANEFWQDPSDWAALYPDLPYAIQWEHVLSDVGGWLIALCLWLLVKHSLTRSEPVLINPTH